MYRTKEAISDAFWQLLEEKPYHKITVQNIVERCQISRNSFYYHFQDIPALVEYSIQEWTGQVIKNSDDLESPSKCILPIAREITKRKKAFIHIYRSSCGETLIRYMNQIGFQIVQSYIDTVTKNINLSQEDKAVFIRYYKCIFAGTVLDWLDAGASYDLPAFCEEICDSFEGSGKRAFLKKANGLSGQSSAEQTVF